MFEEQCMCGFVIMLRSRAASSGSHELIIRNTRQGSSRHRATTGATPPGQGGDSEGPRGARETQSTRAMANRATCKNPLATP